MNIVKLISIPLAFHFKISSSLHPDNKEGKYNMSRVHLMQVL